MKSAPVIVMKTKSFVAALMATLLWPALAGAQITVSTFFTNGLFEPYGLAVDGENNLYVSDSAHNRILRVDAASGAITALAGLADQPPGSRDGAAYEATFNNPQGVAVANVGGASGVVVADNRNHLIRFIRASDGAVWTLAGTRVVDPDDPFGEPIGDLVDGGLGVSRLNYPLGVAADGAGRIYIADSGNNAIRVLDLTTSNLTTLAVTGTTFWQPGAVALGKANELWVADTRNNQVKLIKLSTPTSGVLFSELGSGEVGYRDSTLGGTAKFNGPRGLVWWTANSTLLISDTGNHVVRAATNYTIYGATNYSVSLFAGVPGLNGLFNGEAVQALFDTPVGLATDQELESFLVADLKNNAIRRIQSGPVRPPVEAPRIGWVDFVFDFNLGEFVTVLRTEDQPRIFYNNVSFAVLLGESGVDCKYTTTPTTWPLPFNDVGLDPSKTVGRLRPDYRNGEPRSTFRANIANRQLVVDRSTNGGVVIKAIAYQAGRQNSPIVKAGYGFKVASPIISGNNLAQFSVLCTTTDPVPSLYYTLDGTDPSPSNGTLLPEDGEPENLAFAEGQESIPFKVRGYADADGFLPSDIVTNVFYATNWVPNRISFGFASGEASSAFSAAAGQTFFAPVTLSLLPKTKIYSLQFNLTVTNLDGAASVVPGAVGFQSTLVKPTPIKDRYEVIPPATYWPLDITTNLVAVTNISMTNNVYVTNISYIPGLVYSAPTDPPPTNRLIYPYDSFQPYLELQFTNTSLNLVGVGWLERRGEANLYDSTVQDLVKYSMAHDTLFDEKNGKIVVGTYYFQVPSGAAPGSRYQIKIGRPSATSDGVGAPGSNVRIDTPTNAVVSGGFLRAITNVVVSPEPKTYVVGDAAPFGWFNAGDFGNGLLLNDDVMQVFQSAIYKLNTPPRGSDFYDALDSGGVLGVPLGNGTYAPWGGLTGAGQNLLFNGNDTLINDVAFGDGELNVTDVYITFRRSLNPSLWWFKRFWSGGARVAVRAQNQYSGNSPKDGSPPEEPQRDGKNSGEPPAVQFLAGDATGSPGQTLHIPITARVQGRYPLRVLMLNLSVQPLENSPALTDAITFTPSPALGSPTSGFIRQQTNSYGAAWLNAAVAGLTGDAPLGTLSVKIPSNAPPWAAYAIHFDHASGSPNGLGAFPQQTFTGLITLADRSASSLGDGIADAWRLRHFGAVGAVLAAADSDADGDGHNNLQEFKTGTNPNDSQSVLKALAGQADARFVVRWPSIAGKRYVIERAEALFGAPWQAVGTGILGTGWEMGYEDPEPVNGAPRFYRVRMAD